MTVVPRALRGAFHDHLVADAGLEPARPFGHFLLRETRLPDYVNPLLAGCLSTGPAWVRTLSGFVVGQVPTCTNGVISIPAYAKREHRNQGSNLG